MKTPSTSDPIATAMLAGAAARARTAAAASATNIAPTHATRAMLPDASSAIDNQAQTSRMLEAQITIAGKSVCMRDQARRLAGSSASGFRNVIATPPSAARLAIVNARAMSFAAIAAANQK
jgi:hypothetical protein